MISYYNTYGRVTMSGSYFSELVSDAVQSGFGVAGMAPGGPADSLRCLVQPNFADKGVRVRENAGRVDIDLHIKVTYGLNVTEAVRSVTHKVRYTVEDATGLKVGKVNVFVDDVVT